MPFFKLAGPQLEVFFNGLTPPPAELEWFVPSSILYGFFHSLLGLFGVLYIALGLSQARHWAYRSSARVAGFVVLAVGIVDVARDRLLVHAGGPQRRRDDAAAVGVPHRLDRAGRRSRS